MDLLRHLEYFLAVVDEGSFSRAAEALGMAQPPLSQRVRGLEAHLGCELFDRSRRQIRLTAAGNLLVPEARTLVELAADLPYILTAHPGQRPALRVDLPDIFSLDAAIHLTTSLAEAIGEHVDPRQLPARERTSPPMDQHPVIAPGPGPHEARTPLGLAIHPSHALAGAAVTPHPSDFADAQIVLLAEDAWQETSLRAGLSSQGVPGTCIQGGVDHQTALIRIALEDACLLTDAIDADTHQLHWTALAGLERVWHTTGEHDAALARCLRDLIGADHG